LKLAHAAQNGLESLTGAAGRFLARLAAARGGGVAMMTALAMPPILLVALGAVQLQALVTDKGRTQDVADSAALWGAQQLTVTPSGVTERTISYAQAQLDKVKANATVTVAAEQIGKSNIKVTIDTERPSFFFNLLPAGGFRTHVESVAEGVSQTPLCVLIVGDGSGDELHMRNSSKLQGPQCMVHSNGSVMADGSALIQAQTVEASTTASGPISPTASTGAPPIDDPFGSLNYAFPAPCLTQNLLTDTNPPATLPATTGPLSMHIVSYKVPDGATMTLAPGRHYFCGDLELGKGSILQGDGVALIFWPGAKVKFKDAGSITLHGMKTGNLAGFVILTDRNYTSDFKIDSDSIADITGTIYVPGAKLQVDGSKKSGTGSAWTVLAAKAFEGKGGANLVINANYAGTDVPVPSGVGNRKGMSRITE
jgi:hypothetical protein